MTLTSSPTTNGARAPITGTADRADVATLIAANKACGCEFHPAANLFPPMTDQEFDDLVADIRAHGLNEPIVLRDDMILEGRHRALACEKIGIKPKIQECPSNDPYAYVISANLHRRHVTAEQKRELIAKVLKAKPGVSNRLIAKQIKADRDRVAEVRRDLETTGGIPPVEKTVGADGKARKKPATAKRAIKSSKPPVIGNDIDPEASAERCKQEATADEAAEITKPAAVKASSKAEKRRRAARYSLLVGCTTDSLQDIIDALQLVINALDGNAELVAGQGAQLDQLLAKARELDELVQRARGRAKQANGGGQS